MWLAYIKLTEVAKTSIRPLQSKYLQIQMHYALIRLNKENKMLVNILTTKPFGKFTLISDKAIHPTYKCGQFIQHQTYQINPEFFEFEETALSKAYFLLHKEKFTEVLNQIKNNDIITI